MERQICKTYRNASGLDSGGYMFYMLIFALVLAVPAIRSHIPYNPTLPKPIVHLPRHIINP
jgi:hypothetical protein